MIYWILLPASAAIISFFVTLPVVWILEFFHLTQHIREEGPPTHKKKAGTPTMGGIGFIIVIIAFAFIFVDFDLDLRYLALIILTFGYAAIGLIDDLIKIYKQRNEGLTFRQKMILQTLLAAAFSFFLVMLGHNAGTEGLLKTLFFSNAVLFFLLSTFIIVGSANAANLTDGLNGLLAGTGAIAFLAFGALSVKSGAPYAATFSLASAGAVSAFLFFNFPKARVFMGDVASLPIGAALAGIAIIIHRELWLAVIGGVFLIEALSVMIQVGCYKLFKKRIFKMTPLHHHFELLGFRETTIVIGFWIAAAVLGVVGVLI